MGGIFGRLRSVFERRGHKFKIEGDFGIAKNRLLDHSYQYIASCNKELFKN